MNVSASAEQDARLGVVIAAPDWVCVVLSASTAPRDRGPRGVNWKAYQRAGVEWYWLLDLDGETLTIYQRTARSYEVIEVAGAGDVMRLPPLMDVEFALLPLFIYGRAQV